MSSFMSSSITTQNTPPTTSNTSLTPPEKDRVNKISSNALAELKTTSKRSRELQFVEDDFNDEDYYLAINNSGPLAPAGSTACSSSEDFIIRRPSASKKQKCLSDQEASCSETPRKAEVTQKRTSTIYYYPKPCEDPFFPVPSEEFTQTVTGFLQLDNSNSEEAPSAHFNHMLHKCWDVMHNFVIDPKTNAPTQDIYPLFLEKDKDGLFDVLAENAQTFYLIGSELGRGKQSTVRHAVKVVYSDSEGFKLDKTHPHVACAHAIQNLKRRKDKKLYERYSQRVIDILEKKLPKCDVIVPKPIFCATLPNKVTDQPKNVDTQIMNPYHRAFSESSSVRETQDQGRFLGQVTIEPVVYDKSSANYKFSNVEEIKQFGIRVAEGLRLLHDNNVIHRDIRSDNIFVLNNKAFIGDLESLHVNGKRLVDKEHNISIGHVLNVETAAQERIAFGYLLKDWLRRYAQASDQHIAADKDARERLFALAHGLTHENDIPRTDNNPPPLMPDIIEKLEKLDLNS